ncbi:MAG: riboflavin synthase [Proteobacteria bacterium]|nr:riboflavin synthase [Pseudomonadota bacterium]
MFTGIITNIGIVESLNLNNKKDLLISISTLGILKRKLEIGCSIACSGICLTLLKKKKQGKKNILYFQASKETLDKTTLKSWKIGDLINLEFALKVGDELGGHLVSGHVDGTAKISEIKAIKDSRKFTFVINKDLLRFIAQKGSITINGTSLTINQVNGSSFSVNLIWHTLENTAFKISKIGDLVNIEVDMLARYLERMLNKK